MQYRCQLAENFEENQTDFSAPAGPGDIACKQSWWRSCLPSKQVLAAWRTEAKFEGCAFQIHCALKQPLSVLRALFVLSWSCSHLVLRVLLSLSCFQQACPSLFVCSLRVCRSPLTLTFCSHTNLKIDGSKNDIKMVISTFGGEISTTVCVAHLAMWPTP